MPTYTPSQIYGFLKQAGFTPDQAVTMTAIALAESGGNTSPHNPGGEDSWGLWQINVDARPGAAGTHDPYDPLTDARAVYDLSQGGTDISPWTVTHGGSSARYARFRRDALTAAAAFGDNPSGTRTAVDPRGRIVAAAALLVMVLGVLLGPRLTAFFDEQRARVANSSAPGDGMALNSPTPTPSPSSTASSAAPSVSVAPSGSTAATATPPATSVATAAPPATRVPVSSPAATVAPTRTPPSSPPTSAPSAAASPHTVSLSVTSPVRRGFAASARASTTPSSRCTIVVTYSRGPSTEEGLGPKSADAAGGVSWSWTVATATSPGAWPVEVTCISQSGERAAARATLQVQ